MTNSKRSVEEELRRVVRLKTEALEEIGRWRKDCHAHDADMGHEPRDFDSEDWDMVESFARRAAALRSRSPLEDNSNG